ncbi:MAG: DUF2892 domain-containing protein [Thermaurantimonas sp.]
MNSGYNNKSSKQIIFEKNHKPMKANVGKLDKGIRLTIAVVALVLYFTKVLTGTVGIVALVLAGLLVFTSLVNFCPAYTLFGINTCETKK